MPSENVLETDVLVVGGGMAGCFAAIKAKEKGVSVTLVDKGSAGTSGSSPFAANLMIFNPRDERYFDECLNRFNARSEYINNRNWTELLIRDSYERYQDLVNWGVEFLGDPNCQEYRWSYPELIIEGIRLRRFFSMPMIRKQVKKAGVRILDRILITELLTNAGKVVGALGIEVDSYDTYVIRARSTVICTGAASFRPPGWPVSNLTADGEAMAYRIGAEIGNKEFVDTHETETAHPAPTFGMWQERVTAPQKPDLLPPPNLRDAEPKYWNSEGAEIKNPLPGLSYTLDRVFEAHAGRAPIFRGTGKGPIAVAAGTTSGMSNHACEGIWLTSNKGASGIPGLFAAGDSCTANPMGAVYNASGAGIGNAAVTGARAGWGAAEYALETEKPEVKKDEIDYLKNRFFIPKERKGGFSPRWVTQVLQNLMAPYYVLYIKKADRLKAALTMVEFIRENLVPKMVAGDPHELRLAYETKNLVYNAEAKLRTGFFRTESRGTHYREDYPHRNDPKWLAWVTIKQGPMGIMTVKKRMVPKKWWPDLTKPYTERYPVRFPGE